MALEIFKPLAAIATTPTAAKQLQQLYQLVGRILIMGLRITFTQPRFSPDSELPKVQRHPRVLWVGIGCKRGTSRQVIESAIEQVCRNYHLALGAIAGIATIDIKADEIGLIELCQGRKWPLKTFSADVLNSISVPNPSNIVAAELGTPSVAEASAICATINESGSKNSLLVSKQIFRLEGQPGAVTVAISLAEKEYIAVLK